MNHLILKAILQNIIVFFYVRLNFLILSSIIVVYMVGVNNDRES